MKEIKSRIRYLWEQQSKIFPWKTFFILLALWGDFIGFYLIILSPLNLDIPEFFPISLIYEKGFHPNRFTYLIFFFIIIIILLWFYKKINEFLIIINCGILIVLGNFMQKSIDHAFLQPFYSGVAQYYSDAIQVPANWLTWLGEFNANQALLSIHGRTHPPFAILIHNLFLFLSNDRLSALAIAFSLISMGTIFLIWIILRIYDIDLQNRKLFLLLFALLPAVNIYSIVSLDGVIMTTSTLFLLGVVILIKKPQYKIIGISCMASGLLFTNLLTYGGLFLIGVGVLLAVFDYSRNKGIQILKGLTISILVLCAAIFILNSVFNYDHINGFLTASKLENPDGFRLFSEPKKYLLSRFEDVSEIAFFLSFGVLATFINSKLLVIHKKEISLDNPAVLSFIGLLVLLAIFLSGAYRTGETARACLFIYPFLILNLVNLEGDKLKGLIILAGIQTAIMQLFANYFW